MDTLDTMKQVEASLTRRGINAHLEYPGFILIGDWAFGTANENWGGDNSWVGNESVEFKVRSDSTDAEAIAAEIENFIRIKANGIIA